MYIQTLPAYATEIVSNNDLKSKLPDMKAAINVRGKELLKKSTFTVILKKTYLLNQTFFLEDLFWQ